MDTTKPITLAVISTLVPESEEFRSPVLSVAGQRFQRSALEALQRVGLPARLVLSQRPVPPFPADRRLWFPPRRRRVGAALEIELLPVLNVQPLKHLVAGCAVFIRILLWGIREQRAASRAVLAINLSQPPGLFVYLACRLTGTRLIGWLLDVFEPGRLVPDSLLRRLDFRAQCWLIPRLDGLVVVADDIARELAPGKPFLRIEGGVDRDAVRDVPPAPQQQERVFRCLFAGSLEEFNGISLMLAACRRLQDCPVVLQIAGGGSLEAAVRQAASVGLPVEPLGILDFDELWRRYGAADLLLNVRPTRSLDTRYFFPSKLMEYMASGTPVVSTCTGHVEAEFGEFVYLLREETPEALAGLILRIAALDPAERRGTGASARRYVLAHKTWDRQAEKLVDFLRHAAMGDLS